MRWGLGLAAKLYPKAWSERYGTEFACLLDDVDPRWTDVVDVLRGAVMMQIGAWSSYLKLVGAVAAAGVIVAVVLSFVLPGLYVSSAVVQAGRMDDPQTLNRINESWQDVVSRSSLSEIIQRPNLDLYKGERNRHPLEDVIEDMKRKRLKVEVLKDRGAFRVSFVYPDRYKAQAVVDALTQKVRDASRAGWMAAPASLPQSPVAPDRLAFTIWGLGIGLVAGVVTSFFRWRAKWTLKVLGFGLAVCVIATSLAWLVPNRYTSTSTLRVIPAPKADGVRRYMQEAEMAAWLQKKEREILSDESLYEIIQRRAIDLYHKEREEKSIGEVVSRMRRDLTIEAPRSHSAFTISFTHSDRFKAQRVVAALVDKFIDSEVVITEADLMLATYTGRARTIDDCVGKTGDAYVACVTAYLGPIFPAAEKMRRRQASESIERVNAASLPESPVGPNRNVLAAAGLFVGLLLGAYLLRHRSLTVTVQ